VSLPRRQRKYLLSSTEMLPRHAWSSRKAIYLLKSSLGDVSAWQLFPERMRKLQGSRRSAPGRCTQRTTKAAPMPVCQLHYPNSSH
jgi:hypothetical protein